jgi:heterodisulfide reductase subunit A
VRHRPPYEGEIRRASDKKHPRNIAWIQCVGSRRVTEGDNSYCSATCCTYTQKQVILTKDHDTDAACTIFHNDIRSYGKDFEPFFQRAEQLPGCDLSEATHRSSARIRKPGMSLSNTHCRRRRQRGILRHGGVVRRLESRLPNSADLAETFGIELNEHGFCKTNPSNPMETSRPGIFVSGAFQGPMDIPESVFTASAAGSQCGQRLDYRRGKLTTAKVYPPERDVSEEEPRIGVFVCHCGTNIGRVVDVPPRLNMPDVAQCGPCQEQLFSCATNSIKEITDTIKEKGLNRVVVAACSPRTLEPLFRDTLREAGINQYFYDMANIREHCSWCHSKEKEAATQKAKDITRMSVARSAVWSPCRSSTCRSTRRRWWSAAVWRA